MNKHRALGPLQVVAATVTSVMIIAGASVTLWNWQFWYKNEETKMERVSVGMPVFALESSFGPPNKRRPVEEGGYLHDIEYPREEGGHVLFWKERGYWVIAHVVDEVIEAYQIRICDPRMKPSLLPHENLIVANKTSLAEVVPWRPEQAEYSASAGWYGYFEGTVMPLSAGGGQLHWGVGVASTVPECETPYGRNTVGGGEVNPKWHLINGARGSREETFAVNHAGAETPLAQQQVEETRQSLVINIIGAQRQGAPFPPSASLAIHPSELARIN